MRFRNYWTSIAVLWMIGVGLAFAQEVARWEDSRKDPLAELFPAAEIKDEPSLNLKRISDTVVEEKTLSDAAIRRMEIEFTSFVWAGETWRHRAALFIPTECPAAYRDAALVNSNGDDKKGIAKAQMGIANVVLIDVPGKRYGYADAGALMGYGDRQFIETGDPHWLGYPWLARVFMRAITAARATPEFGLRRFVVTGGSKWGVATWIATAVDDRVVGGVAMSWNLGNIDKALELRVQRMGGDFKPIKSKSQAPASLAAGDQLKLVRSPQGRRMLAYMDPYVFRGRLVSKPVLYMDGTNDPLFPVDGDTVFLPEMPGDIRIDLVPNKGHVHPAAVQQAMWLAHIFAGRDVPRIDLAEREGEGRLNVTATVSCRTRIKSVIFWTATAKDRIYLQSEWKATVMRSMGEGRYQASLAKPAQGSAAYIIMVEDDDPDTVPGVITTGFHEWPRQ